MIPALSITLREPLRPPVEVIEVGGLPKVMACKIPVTPINVALKSKVEDRGATKASIDAYARAGRLFTEFTAHRGRSIVDVTDEEFRWYVQALQGKPFLNGDGKQVLLSGQRGPRTADLMIELIYSIGADIEELYGIRLDWRRYLGAPRELVELARTLGRGQRAFNFRRAHRVRYTPRKVMGLPDDEFLLLLLAARERWGNVIADGDAARAPDPEKQRGALFYRNISLLLSLRFSGARRSEAPLIRPEDLDRARSRIYLTTKGHRGERLPVILNPLVEAGIWHYVTRYRPVTPENSAPGYPVHVSHSTRNYGSQISGQSVRKVIDALRQELTPPWNELVSPHTLRHSFSVDLQINGGEAATTVNMRHASQKSLDSYEASPEVFADQILGREDKRLTALLSAFGIGR
jgi:integrase